MTGKAPPTGPRALRGSIPPGSTPSTPLMSTPGASTSTTPTTLSGPRSMATPPTGPRSLINGAHPRSQPPSSTVFSQGKHTTIVNGHVPQTSSSGSIAINARLPPSGPKGKGVDTSWAGSARRPPTGPSALSGRSSLSVSPTVPNLPLRVSRQVSPVASTSSPSPKLPPPPPPSEGPPPPPPPPSSPPPPPPPEIPHLISPIKLPTNQPQEPRLAPPPLPSDPAPPSSAPPPLPPPPSIPISGPSIITESRQPFSIQLPPKPTTRLKSPSPPPPPPPQRTPSPVLAPYVSVSYTTENGKQVKQYSLKKPPAWPPPRSEYPDGTDFRVLFDPSVDKDRNGTLKKLFDNVRAAAARDAKLTQRIVDKGKGREILYRFAGETIPGELVPVPADPRKAPGFRRAFKGRNEFHLPTYEYDSNSTGPPPPTTVLILNLPTLVPNNQIRRYFSQYGSIASFDHEIDRATGAALGIVSIQFSSHEEAKACVEKEDGKKFGSGSVTLGFVGMASRATESDVMRVVLDGEGKKLKAVLAELDDRKRKVREEKLRIQKENEGAAQAVPSPAPHAKPPGAPGSWRNHTVHNPPGKQALPHRPPPNAGLPSKPLPPPASLPNQNGPQNARAAHAQGQGQNQGPPSPTRPRKQPSWVAAGRHSRAIPMAERFQDSSLLPPEAKLGGHSPGSSSSTPLYMHGARRGGFAHRRPFPMPHGHGARRDSRSPSPDVRVPGIRPGHRDSQYHHRTDDEHKAVLKELALNGRDHVHVRESEVAGGHVTPEDLKERFKMFQCDRILHDYRGWFVTFTAPDAAKRAEKVYSLSPCHLANRPVQIRAFPAPKLEDITPDGKGKLGSGASESEQRVWSKQDLIREAEKLTIKELETVLEKDIMDRVVGVEVRRLVAEERSRDRIYVPDVQVKGDGGVGVQKQEKLKGLKSLSFRKRKQHQEKTKENVVLKPVAQSDTEDEGRQEREQEQGHEEVVEPEVEVDDYGREKLGKPFEVEVGVKERPRKRAKSEVSSAGPSDVESEDEDEPETVIEMPTTEIREPIGVPTIDTSEPLSARDVSANKRSPSPPLEDDARASKRQKVSQDEGTELLVTDDVLTSAPSEPLPVQPAQEPQPMSVPELVTVPVQEKRSSKKAEKKKPTARKEKAKAEAKVVAPDEEIFIPPVPMDVDVVPVAEVHVIPPSSELPTPSSPSLGRVRSPVLEKATLSLPQPPSRSQQLPESELQELCEDDEDLYFAKLAMTLNVDENFTLADPSVGNSAESHVESSLQAQSSSSPQLRKHVTGSARTEGYYKISHAEKSAYVAQYAVKQNVAETVEKPEATQKQAIASSRSNRANARRRAQGLEEMNQVQLAVALSKGQSGATEVVKFNQLQTRKKHLRFGRSPIHDWGLYAMERILKGEMVIEYVGEVIRAAVADKREKQYERQGIGSSYLFRINEDLVVDATKKGNLGRLINHSCDPNCTAKIITINGEKKIVIYAKQDIELGDEITYDYHFPIEQDKIPCLCGSLKCRGFLN